MQSYLLREHAVEACRNMKLFYIGLANHYKKFGLNIESNRGRRNILMSEPMESFLAKELKNLHNNVIADGRSGKADIIIQLAPDHEIELECKLTSPHESSGSICFQTDYETLEKKGSLDYIYIIANEDFTAFCAIHFMGLTLNDYRKLSPGARGKVQMFKHRGMKKGKVLIGEAIDLNKVSIQNSIKRKELYIKEITKKITNYDTDLQELRTTQIYDRNKIGNARTILKHHLQEKINKLDKEITIKKNRVSRYTFKYEKIGDIKK